MLSLLILSIALASSLNGPLDAALESFHGLASYRVTIRSSSDGSSQVVRYYFKSPGLVRMEFIRPHNGAVLVYNPAEKRARLRPFGFLKPFVLTLDPGNRLITTPQGHRVDASDMGSFLGTVKSLAEKGESRILGTEKVGGRDATLLQVEGAKGVTVDGGVHRYLLWLDMGTFLPIRTVSFDRDGNQLEDVVMDDLEINVELPMELFEL